MLVQTNVRMKRVRIGFPRESLVRPSIKCVSVAKAWSDLYQLKLPLLQFTLGAGTAALGLVFCLRTSLDSGLAWCPWCPLTSEFGSTGLKQATQANRLNLRKATKDADFR